MYQDLDTVPVRVDQLIDDADKTITQTGSDPDFTENHSVPPTAVLPHSIQEMPMYTQEEMDAILKQLELKHEAQLLEDEKEWEREQKHWTNRLRTAKTTAARYIAFKKQTQTIEDSKLAQREKTTLESGASEKAESELNQCLEEAHSLYAFAIDMRKRYDKVCDSLRKQVVVGENLVIDEEELAAKVEAARMEVEQMREQAQQKLDEAVAEAEELERAARGRQTILEATLRKKNMDLDSLQKNLDRKTEENKKLNVMFEELITKVE